MRERNLSISEEEFLSLPAALRRKYFSSLERLRLVQDGVTSIPSSRHERSLSRSQTRLRSRSQHRRHLSRKRSAPSSLSHYYPEHRPSTTSSISVPSLQTSAWFRSLPPTVQRKHFSPAEQLFLGSRVDNVILDAADEAFYKRGRQRSRPWRDRSLSPGALPGETPEYRQREEIPDSDPDSEMDETLYDDFRWLDEDEELDLRLDNYHIALRETTSPTTVTPRKPSFRHHLSLSSLSFRRSTSISSLQAGASITPVSITQIPPSPRPISSLLHPNKHHAQRSVSSIDPRASHYQDPAARLKLRVYLASPQKFDEAIEFGFPSSQGRLHGSRPKTSPRLTHESGRTFFTDDTPSLSADEEDEEDKEVDVEDSRDPLTPEETLFQSRRSSHKGGSDRRMTITPKVVRGPYEPYAQASVADREMTLHMTLTRPDLRGANELNIKSINEEPLEQAALAFEDVTPSIWDTLPEDNSRMKRIWRKLTHR